ncbi:hypothetical protein B5X24_HaOG202308 [Helicoverpa armigera]|uniref:Uncharacterized protein n=1 Tax=Helicoverpa armigera TaxID=29058 RepID=A0A2W1C2E4_HELAM|nr:hypothetical protein B5X24_HaOG202308 [Helicoverpa armigera]
MQETVTNANERKSLFSSFLEVLEIREKQAQADRQLQEEKYLRRTQRIYDFHERQRREAAELRRCLDYVSQHAHVLESVLRGAGAADAPLSACLLRQAAALQRCMAQCVANASRIRHLLAATHQPQMDTMLAKMPDEKAIQRDRREISGRTDINVVSDAQVYLSPPSRLRAAF